MGLAIDREDFEEADYARFSERLEECVAALARLWERPGFGEGPATVGAELELFLLDRSARPAPVNLQVLEHCRGDRFTVELNRFNLELNLPPAPLKGRPFSAFLRELDDTMGCARAAGESLGARPVAIGILPTLRQEELGPNALTPLPRYRALDKGIRRSRQGAPLRFSVSGEDALNLEWDWVTFEGANTSLQFHLRVPPRTFADAYNAAQLATAPVLALSGNSPFFLGHRLWDETRVALFRQATDDRGDLPMDWTPPARVSFGRGWMRKGPVELFAEGAALHQPLLPVLSEERPMQVLLEGRLPSLDELRLHNGTVWMWNRPVYDPHGDGHVRIELRALPAGPTPLDMMANGALLIGLTLGLAPQIEKLLPGLPFLFARENFHRAARDGIDAVMLWPTTAPPSPRPIPVLDLLPRLLDVAAWGLEQGGVEREEYEPLLAVIRDRAAARMTGARWQRRALALYEAHMPRLDALVNVTERYLSLQQKGKPVHEWPVS